MKAAQYLAGDVPKMRKYRNVCDRLELVVQEFDVFNIVEYLGAVASNIAVKA